jgi:hypothetical protein
VIPLVSDELRVSNRAEFDRLLLWLAGNPYLGTFAVSGSREWADPRPVTYVLDRVPLGATMFHGAARGLDITAAMYWGARGGAVLPFPVTREQWRTIGRAAGNLRNERMLNRLPECLIAWHRGASPGTAHAVGYARSIEIPTFVFRS